MTDQTISRFRVFEKFGKSSMGITIGTRYAMHYALRVFFLRDILRPCSIKYVHVSCLQRWLYSKD